MGNNSDELYCRANNYQNEESETWIGEWLSARKNRDSMVIATKFTTCFPAHQTKPRNVANHAGNSTKSLRVSVEASLRKLQTEYIDLLYVHWWDFSTSVSCVWLSGGVRGERGWNMGWMMKGGLT
jgi:aryl-alcohol dehydrogenase-like predicted oxidoreductase